MHRWPSRLLIVCLIAGLAALAVGVFRPVAGADDDAPRPNWMWRNRSAQPNEVAYFRTTFEIEGDIKSAALDVACDDEVTVFLNGRRVLDHTTWQQGVRRNVAERLVEGKNVIALRGRNGGGGPAALIVSLTIETDDGKQTIISDDSWRAAAEVPDNWRDLDCDDSKWATAVSLGKLGVRPWGTIAFGAFQAPDSLATPAESITVPEGFRVELLYSVPKETEGSWVNMTTDPKGRLIVSDQYGSLYRVTPGEDAESTHVERLDVEIGQAHGLLWAFDSLYVMVNGSAAKGSGLYRVRDTDGDDQFDRVELLKRIYGEGEHGPHAIRLGPDGLLYVISGNHTKIPDGSDPQSPHRNWAEDLLLPRNPDGGGHATGVMAPGGWIARTDKDGKKWELFCAGFRNAFDFDFNLDGELFTYDADMEWDTGAPWYRPTRVNHCTSAAEFGWRFGTGKWPDYSADSLGAVVDIGLGSPTGICFGTGAKFPEKYQRALYISDWTYGKVYAVHIEPQGSSYNGSFSTFIEGKPLPMTDVAIGGDGAMYFTVGGRRTQSGLYRVSYVGDESTEPANAIDDPAAAEARKLRHGLEAYHGRKNPAAIEAAWPHLNNSDRALRYAARVAIEHQDVELWREKALAETRTTAAIHALLALTRAGDKSLQGRIVERLNQLPYEQLSEEQALAAMRVYQLAFIRMGKPAKETADAVVERLNQLFPGDSEWVNRELFQVLVYLEAPGVAERGMQQLADAQTQQEQMFYAFVLRNVADGWSEEQRRAYFSWMNLAESRYRGGASFQKFVQQIRRDAAEKLSDDERVALKDVIEGRANVEVVRLETTRQFVHNWQMDDLVPLLSQADQGRSFEKGKAAYEAAQCYKCHRFNGDGGSTGPDLTGVGNRFDARYLLEALVLPSQVVSDQYVNTVIYTNSGEVITGRIIEEDDQWVKVRTDPFARELVEISKAHIDERQPSKLSEMPQGLINTLTPEEILDLIAYLRSAGNVEDRAFGN